MSASDSNNSPRLERAHSSVIEGEQEQFIKVRYNDIIQRLSAQYLKHAMNGARLVKEFDAFSENIFLSVNAFYARKTSGAKEYWGSGNFSTKPEEDSAVLNVLQILLAASQYSQLTNFKLAMESSYEFNFPISVHWGKTDSELLTKWYLNNGIYEEAAAIPDFSKHVLVCTRGTSTEKKKGLFLFEKIDILLERYGVWLSDKIFSALPAEANKPSSVSNAKSDGNKQQRGETVGSVFGKSHITRTTIADHVEEHGLRSLWKVNEIEEPLFDDVIVVYRPKDDRRYTTTRNQVQIHQYSGVPFGDLEAILPFKTIQLAPLDTVKFTVQVVLLLSFIHISLADLYYPDENEAAADTTELVLVFLLLIGLVSRLVSLIMYYLTMVTFYERQLDEWLQKKREGRNCATLSKLCDEVCVQEAKEMILAYFFLWRLGPMTLQELDGRVERFLQKEFQVELDFDAEDAIAKLVSVGLASPVDQQLLENFNEGSFGSALQGADRFEMAMTPEEWLDQHPLQHILDLKIR